MTEPSIYSTTKELKSAASASVFEVVALPLYTLVPVFCTSASIIVILSFGLIVLSLAAAITRAAIAFAFASVSVPTQLVTFAALRPLVADSSKENTPPSRTPAGPAAPSAPSAPSAPADITAIGIFEI